MEHGTAPDHRSVVGDEVPHRQTADTVGRRGHDQVTDDQRIGGDTEHPRNREPVDVGVEDPHVVPHPGQGHGQVHRDRRFPDPALPRRDAEDPRLRSRQHEPVGPTFLVPELIAVGVTVVVALGRTAVDRLAPEQHPEAGAGFLVHEPLAHRHVGDSGHPAHRLLDPGDQLVDLGIVGHREGDLDGHVLALHLHRADHAQLPQRTAQFGIDHRGHSRCDLGLVNGHGGSPRGISPSPVD